MSRYTKMRVMWGPFAGAPMYVNFSTSKRKILGLYEYVLNDWLAARIAEHSTYIDVGANNGYHTFGFAHAATKAGHDPKVIAIEPEHTTELTEPQGWAAYADCEFTVIPKYCSEKTEGDHISLPDVVGKHERALIKIDVEGAEEAVMRGAAELLSRPGLDWCIEIHGLHRIPIIAKYFCEANRSFLIKEMGPLPIIGAEPRPIKTTWLLTV